MKPPMHDPITLKTPVLVDGQPVKDDRGFPEMTELNFLARVIEESTLIIDDKGQERQATFTIMMPETIIPKIGDTVVVNGESVTIIKRKPRKSYSGKKIYYWVTNCGT